MGRTALLLVSILGFVWCILGNKIAKVRPEERMVAPPHEFPHHVFLFTQLPQGKGTMICGGSIVSRNYVLTSARCVHKFDKKNIQIRAGVNERSRQILKAGKVIIHPCFKPNEAIRDFRNDIALIRLSSQVSFDGQFVTWIKADFNDRVKNGGTVTIIGWGRTKEIGVDGEERVLKEADLTIIGVDKCKKAYQFMEFLDDKGQICADNEIDAAFACEGDSGGTLICNGDKEKYVCGITSFVSGERCKNKTLPAVFTRVSRFRKWIKNVVGNGRQSSLDCVGGSGAGRIMMVNFDAYFCSILVLISLKYIM